MQTAAAVVALSVLALLTVFQIALVLGAPWGRFAWGGQHEVLPNRLRVGSAVSVALYAVFAAIVADRAGLVEVLPDPFSRVGIWVLAGYSLIGIVMNLASRSIPERVTMAPVSAVLCASFVVVALGG